MPFWLAQESLTALQWAGRAAVAFVWLMVVTRLMGQREIGRLTLFDFIIAIMIGSVFAGPLSGPTQSLIGALISVSALALLNIAVAYLALKNAKLLRVVQEEPLVLIQNGQLLEDTMRKARLNLSDLLMELRLKNVPNLADVEFAILEPNGKVSVIPKSQARPVTPSDLQLSTDYEGMPTLLIEDGTIIEDNLRENRLDKAWLIEQLRMQGVDDPDTVLAAMLDTRGRLYVSKMNQTNDELVH